MVIYRTLALSLLCLTLSTQTFAKTLYDLEFGAVLFEFYQENYMEALIEYEVTKTKGVFEENPDPAEILKGGILLSFGLAEESEVIFEGLLGEGSTKESVRNRAWFYLAKMYYQRDQFSKASQALGRLKGKIPQDIQQQYYYLAMLINLRGKHLDSVQNYLDHASVPTVFKPFLRYNLALNQANAEQLPIAKSNLQFLADYSGDKPELVALSDRARHALALLSIEVKQFNNAWKHLEKIRTSGLYSNRALLSYGWSALELKQYDQAIPALQLLNQRSIALPEVQEAKVMLPHVYELLGDKRQALKQYMVAVKDYEAGIASVDSARQLIAQKDVPEEFVVNLDQVMEDPDWYGAQPTVDYQQLTPFLLDLLSSHSFQESLRELADLYAMRRNLIHWHKQKQRHELVLTSEGLHMPKATLDKFISNTHKKFDSYSDQGLEIRLYTKVLQIEDQRRFEAILDTTQGELRQLGERLSALAKIDKPYVQPDEYQNLVFEAQNRVNKYFTKVDDLIAELEIVLREIINEELRKHEERINYYWAQARLAKARLLDETLQNLDNPALKTQTPSK